MRSRTDSRNNRLRRYVWRHSSYWHNSRYNKLLLLRIFNQFILYITGLTSDSELRTTALSDGSGIECFIKLMLPKMVGAHDLHQLCRVLFGEDFLPILLHLWIKVFHKLGEFKSFTNIEIGIPMSGEVYPVMTPGRKQEWAYIIHYFGGDTQRFTLPCITLPITLQTPKTN